MEQKLRSEPPFLDKNSFLRHLINAFSWGKVGLSIIIARFTKLEKGELGEERT